MNRILDKGNNKAVFNWINKIMGHLHEVDILLPRSSSLFRFFYPPRKKKIGKIVVKIEATRSTLVSVEIYGIIQMAFILANYDRDRTVN